MNQRRRSDPRSPVQEGGSRGLVPAILVVLFLALIFWGSRQDWSDGGVFQDRPPGGNPEIIEASPAPIAPGPARARANLAAYLTDDDYPQEAIRNEEQGTVSFVLTVSAQGRITDCRVAEGSGSAVLDQATCRLLSARARFQPARDEAGRAIPDEVRGRIRWVLPEG